jgi:hypothetical protein
MTVIVDANFFYMKKSSGVFFPDRVFNASSKRIMLVIERPPNNQCSVRLYKPEDGGMLKGECSCESIHCN